MRLRHLRPIILMTLILASMLCGVMTANAAAASPDINSDGKVGPIDLAIMAVNWGKTSGATAAQGDLNGDGAVNNSDLTLLSAAWGTTGQASQFVTSNGFGFNAYVVNGQPFHAYGSTMYPCGSSCVSGPSGASWKKSSFTQYIDFIIARAKLAHLNTLRPTDYLQGDSNAYDPVVWANIDYLMQQANANGIKIIMDLSTFRKFLEVQNDPTAAPYDPYQPSLIPQWTQFVQFAANRYASNPAILNYSIAGEVDCPMGTGTYKPASGAELTNFYNQVTSAIYSVDQNHLIDAGGLSHLNQTPPIASTDSCGIDWRSIFSLPHVSAATIHVYSDNDEQKTLPGVSAWAQANNKPVEIQEFGFTQDGLKSLCTPQTDKDAQRACDYQRVYNEAKAANAGMVIFWNNGTQLLGTSYEVGYDSTPETWSVIVGNAP